jgi:LysR family nod box-dependent transcriptional activator
VTRAANRLNLSQSGTSTALTRLRDFFGDQLLVPLGRRMILTPLAQTLVLPVREILLQAHTLIDTTPGFNPVTAKRTFTVMASDYVASTFLTRVADRISKEAPGVMVEIIAHEAVPHEPLERGDVDFLVMPEQWLSKDHPSCRLFTDDYVCISCATNRRFASHPDLADYLALGHAVARFGPARGMAFDEWFTERFDERRRVEIVVMNFAMLPLFIVGTERLATVHRRFAEQYESQLPIRIHPLPFVMPPITECLQWNRFSDRHPAVTWCRTLIEKCAKA